MSRLPPRGGRLTHQTARVQFCVRAELGFGETLRVVGTAAPLGGAGDFGDEGVGRETEGLALHTSRREYPIWRSDPIEVPDPAALRYSYKVHSGGTFRHWEGVVGGRSLQLSPYATSVETDDIFGADSSAGERDPAPPSPRAASPAPSTSSSASSASSALGGGVQISSSDGVVVASYRLPVTVRRDAEAPLGWDITWDYDHLMSLRTTRMRVTRVGLVVLSDGSCVTDREEQASLESALRRRFDCVPVFVPKAVLDGMDVFWQATLLPTYSLLVDLYCSDGSRWTSFEREQSAWRSYQAVNRAFCRKVVEVFNEGDMVWIHDLQLTILTSYVMRELKVARVGFFLHSAFPSSELFRTLWCREDLLHGMLNADLVGFHLYEYARHFLACCRRILGLSHSIDRHGTIRINYNGRSVAVVCAHAGIEPPVLVRTLRRQSVADATAALVAPPPSGAPRPMLIASIDALSRLSGISQKLSAFEELLRRHPRLVGQVKLHQRVVTGGAHAHEVRLEKTRRSVLSAAERIRSAFGASSLALEFVPSDEATLESRLPLLAAADAYLVTSFREGLNRSALEYTFAQQETRAAAASSLGSGGSDGMLLASEEEAAAEAALRRSSDGLRGPGVPPGTAPGVVIVSEFVSVMRVLQGALRVNPWRMESIVGALERAVAMGAGERASRHKKHWAFVESHTSVHWSHRVLLDLKGVQKSSNRAAFSAMGFGNNFRLLGMRQGFDSLDTESVVKAFRKCTPRVIFLDYGGTLVETADASPGGIRYFARAAGLEPAPQPESAVLQLLRRLCADKNNTVFVVSGRERSSFADDNKSLAAVPGLGLAAEHGYLYRWANAPSAGGSLGPGLGFGFDPLSPRGAAAGEGWETLLPNFDMSWRRLVKRIMDVYVQRTNGTYVEEKGCALLWQYRDADPEFGEVQSKELEDHLITAVKHFPVTVLRGENPGLEKKGGYIEVRPEGVSKGVFVKEVLSRLKDARKAPQFVLCIGDDSSDEVMYDAAKAYAARPMGGGTRPAVFTCTVGNKPTAAGGYVNTVGDVHELLESLVKAGSGRHHSSVDLTFMAQNRAGMAAGPSGGRLALLAEEPPELTRGGSSGDLASQASSTPSHGSAINRSLSMSAFMPQHHQGFVTMTEHFKPIDEGKEEDGAIFI